MRSLYDELGISSLIVIGGSGDYFDVADTVIRMTGYRPDLATAEAKAIAGRLATERVRESLGPVGSEIRRIPGRSSVDPRKGKREVKIAVRTVRHLQIGTTDLDMTALEQLVDIDQSRALAEALVSAGKKMDGSHSIVEIAEELFRRIESEGLDALTKNPAGDLARFRQLEFLSALNRLRTLDIIKVENHGG